MIQNQEEFLLPVFVRKGRAPHTYVSGYIRLNGDIAVEPEYDDARPFSDGRGSVKKGTLWGAINSSGKLVVPFMSHGALWFVSNCSSFSVAGQSGIISAEGEVLVPPKYQAIGRFYEGLAWFKTNGRYGFLSHSGKQMIDPVFEDVRSFSEGLAPARVNGKFGYIDMNGVFQIPPSYDMALPFSEGLGRVLLGKRWGYIDKSGAFHIRPIFEDARDFYEQLALVKSEGLWGFITPDGSVAIRCSLGHGHSFSEGLAAAQRPKERLFGFIDRTGQFAIKPKYDAVGRFQQNRCLVMTETEIGYITSEGEFVWKGPHVDIAIPPEFRLRRV